MLKIELKQFFETHKAVSIAVVSSEAGYSARSNYIRKLLETGGKDEIPAQLANRLLPVLKKYGYITK